MLLPDAWHTILRRSPRVALAALLAAGSWPAHAGDYSLTCQGETITLTCEDGAGTGNCRTVASSDPAWNVTCRGKDKGNGRFQMDCSNATKVGGTGVELTFLANHLGEELAKAVGDNTGTSCTLAP